MQSRKNRKELNLQIKAFHHRGTERVGGISEDANKNYTEFKKLQQQWNEVKIVPQARINRTVEELPAVCRKVLRPFKTEQRIP